MLGTVWFALVKKVDAFCPILENIELYSLLRHFKTSQINERQIAKFTNRLRGYIDFIGQVRGNDDALYLRNKSAFDDIFKKHVATGIF